MIENNEYGYCSLLKAADQVLNRLQMENRVKSKIGYPYRTDTPLWNERAVRELVINAIVHNDYFNELSPKFELFSDRLEITSAGSLPNGMSRAEFFGGVSNPRNKELMRVFRDVDLVESLGTGLLRVLKVYSEDCFVFMEHFTRVVVPYAWIPSDAESIVENIAESIVEKLPAAQQKIVKLLRDNPSISAKMISDEIGIAMRNVQVHLKKLQEKGIIRRVGPDKGGHWELL